MQTKMGFLKDSQKEVCMYLRALLQTDLCNVQGDGERGFGEMHVRGEKKPRKHRWSDGGMTVGGKGIQRERKHFP